MCKNARLTPLCREEMAKSVLSGQANRAGAAVSFGVTANTVANWAGYFWDLGLAAWADRSLRPRQPRVATPAHVAVRIVSLRCYRLASLASSWVTGKVFDVDGGTESASIRVPPPL